MKIPEIVYVAWSEFPDESIGSIVQAFGYDWEIVEIGNLIKLKLKS